MKGHHIKKSKLWIMVVMIIATFLSFSFDAMAKPKSSKALVKEAAAAYDKEDYDSALSLFQEAYNQDPSSSLIYNMGRVCESKGDYNNALAYYRQFVTTPKADENATTDALNRIEKLEKILTIKAGGSLTQPGKSNIPNANPQLKPVPAQANAKNPSPAGGCIDLNQANVSELTNLSGVGEKKAELIVSSRQKDGPFKSIDELSRLKGFSEKTIDKFRGQLCPIGAAPANNAAPAKPNPKADNKAPAAAPAGCIDLNNGSLADLTNLKGIGEKKAQLIIDSRQKDGPYKSFSDLERVKGFGAKTIEKFSDQLCPIGAAAPAKAAPAKAAAKAPAPNAKSPAKPKTDKEPGLVIDI